MQPPALFSLIYITCPDKASAEELARNAVTSGIAACANILTGMTSIYMWQSALKSAEEVVLLLKTRRSLVKNAFVFVKQNHPYDTPAILEVPLGEVDADYASWLCEALPQHAEQS